MQKNQKKLHQILLSIKARGETVHQKRLSTGEYFAEAVRFINHWGLSTTFTSALLIELALINVLLIMIMIMIIITIIIIIMVSLMKIMMILIKLTLVNFLQLLLILKLITCEN